MADDRYGSRQWVADHRKHHAKMETREDPHSPQHFGIIKVLFSGAELYRTAARDPETLETFGQDAPDDWLERHSYQYSTAGFLLMALIEVLLSGPIGP
ncbi:MAG: hypothetical protein BMS9Abin15_0490 [Gammaproteobacteria bacterium]|nr:MAG: hypothetical protein BMS9Abin15_0490 [Gammaproteobacteria bacterium]